CRASAAVRTLSAESWSASSGWALSQATRLATSLFTASTRRSGPPLCGGAGAGKQIVTFMRSPYCEVPWLYSRWQAPSSAPLVQARMRSAVVCDGAAAADAVSAAVTKISKRSMRDLFLPARVRSGKQRSVATSTGESEGCAEHLPARLGGPLRLAADVEFFR